MCFFSNHPIYVTLLVLQSMRPILTTQSWPPKLYHGGAFQSQHTTWTTTVFLDCITIAPSFSIMSSIFTPSALPTAINAQTTDIHTINSHACDDKVVWSSVEDVDDDSNYQYYQCYSRHPSASAWWWWWYHCSSPQQLYIQQWWPVQILHRLPYADPYNHHNCLYSIDIGDVIVAPSQTNTFVPVIPRWNSSLNKSTAFSSNSSFNTTTTCKNITKNINNNTNNDPPNNND